MFQEVYKIYSSVNVQLADDMGIKTRRHASSAWLQEGRARLKLSGNLLLFGRFTKDVGAVPFNEKDVLRKQIC
ncbi:hypothetical protein DD237_006754 [Peronospora effusa]|uniref:Uncharacterized protein n=1 Tax=Peronospora effusa TaxID=542832 RepID=A0A3R7W3R8_9STRA|nr:hypothetical protein DD237_006754 [Peronospora effusa]